MTCTGKPRTFHVVFLDDEQEAVAAQAASEVGLDVTPFLQKVLVIHLEKIEPTLSRRE